MPYADDIRDLPITNTPIGMLFRDRQCMHKWCCVPKLITQSSLLATEEQVEMATKAIFGGKTGGMEIKKRYDPDLFEDPGIVKERDTTV